MFQRLLKTRFSLPEVASQCAVCRSWPARQVCNACITRFSPVLLRCSSCALPLPPDLSMGLRTSPGFCIDCIRQPPPADATLVAVTYDYPWSDLMTRYKFGDRPGWAAFFAALLLKAPGVAQIFDSLQADDLIIPMPLSDQRLQSRGFNQAWELASQLTQQSATRARADARLLLRVQNTRPQTELKREARLANVRHAFQPDPLRVAEINDRRLVLVDDVMTSGASLFTAARVLKEAGAAHVTAIAFARTPAP